ncbi:MAG: SpoIIE family protein phosphatase [Bacillota bacterium]
MLAQTAYAEDDSHIINFIDPFGNGENYSAIIYDSSNGLPTSVANDVVNTEDGSIWIASYGGLIRYDGHEFRRIETSNGVNSIGRLFLDSEDRLWIGTNEDGAGLMVQDSFRWFSVEEGLASPKTCDIVGGEDGVIYVGTISGISLIYPDYHVETLEQPEIAKVYVENMECGSDGIVHGISSEGDYFAIKGNKLVNYVDHSQTFTKDITSILPDPDDPEMIYFGTEGSEIYHCNAKGSPSPEETIDVAPLNGINTIKQIGDDIWICARNGIGMIDKDGFHLLNDVPFRSSVTEVIEDYQGNLWFCSSRQGLMEIVENRFIDLYEKYDMPEQVVNGTCMCEDDLFVATDTGLAVIGKDGPKTSVPVTSARYASGGAYSAKDLLDLLDGFRIRSVSRDSKNRVWIATWQSLGLLRYDHGELTVFTEEEGLPSDRIRIVDESSDGSILVACTSGVCVIEGDRVTECYDEEEGVMTKETLTVGTGPNGDILIGSNGGGIYIVGKNGTRCITKDDGLTSGVIMHIYYDSKRDIFWLITGNSIAYMSRDYKITTVENFPYSDNLDMYENDRGDMWVLSSDGIYVVSADEMVANKEINYIHYGIANGLPCTAVSNSFSERTKDGILYMAGSTGVVEVNIDEPAKDISDIKMSIPFIEADDERYFPDEKGEYTIPSSARKMSIYSYVFDYSLTDPAVTQQLVGFDKKPMQFRQSELHPMVYTNLKGGSYQFVMTMKGEQGGEDKTISVTINKKNAIYESVWFNIVAGMALLALMFLLAKLYVMRKTKVLEEKHRAETEKARVDNELQTAARIQMAALPHEYPPFPDRTEFDIYASAKPALTVGGDFYDYYLIDDDHLAMVMADVSGKGIPASLYMMTTMVVMQAIAKTGVSVEEVLGRVNNLLCEKNQLEMFITAWMGILELSTGKLIAANAGHEYPIIKRADGLFEVLRDKHGFVLGGMEDMQYHGYELTLQPGDKLFLYTDGLPEATNADLEMFTLDRIVDALNKDPQAAPEQMLADVNRAVDEFVQDAEQFDDLTMLCMEYWGPQA